jgi:hypothetical protein
MTTACHSYSYQVQEQYAFFLDSMRYEYFNGLYARSTRCYVVVSGNLHRLTLSHYVPSMGSKSRQYLSDISSGSFAYYEAELRIIGEQEFLTNSLACNVSSS